MRASLFLLCAIPLAAQPASITTNPLPISSAPSFIDANGNVYVTGESGKGVNPTPGAAQTAPSFGLCPGGFNVPLICSDAIIAKFDTSGNLVWATLLGGPTNDVGFGVTSDADGNVYVTGVTGGSFPTTANAAIVSSTTSKVFAAKISADGSRFIYSTYLPSMVSGPSGITVDNAGNAYVTSIAADHSAVVVKISADGASFLYTYSVALGASGQDSAAAVFVDANGNAYLTGATSSPDFPVTAGVLQASLAGAENAFVTKLDPNGNLLLSTFLGGSGSDGGSSLAVDAGGNVYVAGYAGSLDFPVTAGAFETQPLTPAWSRSPAFFAKLAPDLSAIEFASFFPTAGPIVLGGAGDFYTAGLSWGGSPVTASAPMQCVAGTPAGEGSDFLAHFDPSGALLQATYVPDDAVSSLALASDGSMLLAGDAISDVRFGGADWVAPPCLTSTLLSSATLNTTPAVPGEFVSLIGFGIGPENGVSAMPGVNGTARTLGGVQVMFDGQAAPVIYAQSRQVNVQVPFEVSGQTVVTLNYNGATFGPFTVPVATSNPDLFRLQPNVSAVTYAFNEDGTINGPSNPAPAGSNVTLFGTGFGPLETPCPTGGMNAPGPVNLAAGFSVKMLNGGPVDYAGGAPGLACGVFEIRMQVPADAPPGTLLLFTEWGTTNSNGTAYSYDDKGTSLLYVR